MIIKKPYAFLIKHFRLIHLLLLIPMIYLLTQTRQIVNFFVDYVSNNYTLTNNMSALSSLSSNYINIWMYIAVIIIMLVLIILSLVLQRKNKPTKFYNISIVYYLVIFILITVSFAIFKSIENDTLDVVFAMFVRDIARIIHYSEYIFIIFMAIRGIGFNIKQFNFKNDLDELEISSEDNEEVEFLIGIDADKAKRKLRRFLRELKYYYKENKFIFIMIIIIIIGVIATLLFMKQEVYQRIYRENDVIASGYLNFKIKDSYVSNLTQNGMVLNEDKYYIILQLEITNRYRENHEFNYANLELIINDKYFLPDLSKANYFKDYGVPYNGTYIKGNSSNDYILVYEIDKYLINQDFMLTATSYSNNQIGGIGVPNSRIALNPTFIQEDIISSEINMGTKIDFTKTNLGASTFLINQYEFTNRYQYTYEYCPNKNQCFSLTDNISLDYTGGGHQMTLLVLDYELFLEEDIPYMDITRNYRSFLEDFAKIEYRIGNDNYVANIAIVNPSSYDEKIVLQVPKEIEDASEVELVITIRNISYCIKMI